VRDTPGPPAVAGVAEETLRERTGMLRVVRTSVLRTLLALRRDVDGRRGREREVFLLRYFARHINPGRLLVTHNLL
jgi:hypothetical protein